MFGREETILKIAATVLGLSLISTLVILARRELSPSPTRARQAKAAASWHDLETGDGSIGNPRASHTVVVFTDYECPSCRDYENVVDSLLEMFPQQVRIVFRNFPLRAIHPYAEQAALAVECSVDAGAFDPFRRIVYANQDSLRSPRWVEWGRAAGIRDTASFGDCVRRDADAKRVAVDVALAEDIQLDRTPSVLLDGHVYDEKPSLQRLAAGIRALSKTK